MAVFFTLSFKGQMEVFGKSLPFVILPVKSYERTDIKFITSWTITTLKYAHGEVPTFLPTSVLNSKPESVFELTAAA